MVIFRIVPVIAASLLAQDGQLGRSGDYYVRTHEGNAGAFTQPRLQVITRGHVVLRGATGNQVTYKLTERVKARSEADARRLFGSVRDSMSARNDTTILTIQL